jgi:Trk-type K+ transport system membrane component
MRRQLGFDLWYIFLGLFIICIVESTQIEDTNNYVRSICEFTYITVV